MQFKMGQFIVKALICAARCQKASVCKHAVIQLQISGDLPSSKWLLICIWQSGTELFKMIFVRADADNWWSLTAVICTVHSEPILFGLIRPLECSELMASHL